MEGSEELIIDTLEQWLWENTGPFLIHESAIEEKRKKYREKAIKILEAILPKLKEDMLKFIDTIINDMSDQGNYDGGFETRQNIEFFFDNIVKAEK